MTTMFLPAASATVSPLTAGAIGKPTLSIDTLQAFRPMVVCDDSTSSGVGLGLSVDEQPPAIKSIAVSSEATNTRGAGLHAFGTCSRHFEAPAAAGCVALGVTAFGELPIAASFASRIWRYSSFASIAACAA